MKKIFIFSFMSLMILSTSAFAYVNTSNAVIPTGPGPGIPTYSKPDPKLYDKNGFLIKQATFPENTEYPIVIDAGSNAVIEQKDVKQGEIASCFDYYKFGSVGVNLSTDLNTYDAGSKVKIKGLVKNNNTYPVVGLDIKARLVKNIPSPDKMRAEIMVIDEFDVADNISIDANKEFKISYNHLLPLNTPAGDYQLFFYAVEQDRFNMSGLSFTNDVTAAKINFTVKGSNPNYVYLDQTKIVVGEQVHNVMGFVTQHQPNTLVPVTIPLNNPSAEARDMNVTYDLYSWDAANPANKISTKTEKVTVPAKSSVKLVYNIDKTIIPVYYLTIIAEPANQIKDKSVFEEKTISNIRIGVRDVSKPRINFVTVDTYPLKKGVASTLVTCFQDGSGKVNMSNTKIETVLYDENKKELSRIEYDGKTIPDITGLINKFTTKKDISNFSIVTNMFDDKGNVLDSIEKKYDCKVIDPNMCVKPDSKILYIIISIVGLIIIFSIALIFKRRKLKIKA